MDIIDFRARPNLPQYAEYLYPRLEAIAEQTSGSFGQFRAPIEALDEFVARLDGSGISRAVFAARNRASAGEWALTNKFVASCVEQYPDRLVGFGGIDLEDRRPDVQVHRAVEEFGLVGVCVDPFQIGTDAADPRLDPVYATCCRLRVPVVVTMGGLPGIPSLLACGNPLSLDVAAARHPDLVLVGSHAGWPFVTEMIAVAWRRENVYFENSFYHEAPGTGTLVDAANMMIGHKMLYASAYPFAPMDTTLDRFRSLPFEPDVLTRVLSQNAQRLLANVPDTPVSP